MILSINMPVRGREMTNGDVIQALFPDAEIHYYTNLSDMKTVDVKFKNSPTEPYRELYKTHTFSREWWDSVYKEKRV